MIEILQNKDNLDKIQFEAKDGGEILGSCGGYLDGDEFVFDELTCDNVFADGLVRAILNLMTLHGIDKARFDLPEKKELLIKLGFCGEDGMLPGIAAFFDKKCGGETAQITD